MKNKWYQRSLALLLVLTMALMSGCQAKDKDPGADLTISAEQQGEQSAFDDFLDSLFKEEVVSDTLTLHYTLSDPAGYGVESYPITFGDFSMDTIDEDYKEMQETLDAIQDFNRDLLSADQQLTYDILVDSMTDDLSVKGLDLYAEPLNIGVGIQAQLPVVLGEYAFYSEQDIKDYLALLPEVNTYFEQILTFEREKSAAGLFMPDQVLEEIVQGCVDYIQTPEDNVLLSSFTERLDAFEGLSDEAKAGYIAQNEDAVLNSVIPAYQKLINGLNELKGTGTNAQGLCYFPEGKTYYEYMVKTRTGSSKTVEELIQATQERFQRDLMSMALIMQQSDKDLATEAASFSFSLTDPEAILQDLKGKITADFPEIPETAYTIKYVPESMQDSLSPAFYLTPPIDRMTDNIIYINPASTDSASSLYTTLAHEGYPGHLYQTVYEQNHNIAPIRSLLSYMGYTEGWATYVENYAYSLDDGIDSALAGVVQYNQSATLAVYALMDFHIHYEGWDVTQSTEFLSQIFGLDDASVVENMYYYIVSNPTNYLSYYIGYLEFTLLREEAEEAMGDDFVLKDFHQFVLDLGPAPFGIIEERMQDWMGVDAANAK